MSVIKTDSGVIYDEQMLALGDAAINALQGQARTDSTILPNDLLALENELTLPREGELIVRQIFDIETGHGVHAETVGWDEISREGNARVQDYADDILMVDNKQTRKTRNIYPILTGFRITMQELRAARATGQNVQTDKAATARRFIANVENSLALNGDSTLNLEGLFNAAGATTVSAGISDWSDAGTTGALIIDDLRVVRNVVNGKDGIEARALVLSSEDYEHLHKFINTAGSTRTVLEFLLDNDWFPSGIFKSELVTAGKFAIIDNSREMMRLSLPLDITLHGPFATNPFTNVFGVEERFAGLLVKRPEAIAYGSGI